MKMGFFEKRRKDYIGKKIALEQEIFYEKKITGRIPSSENRKKYEISKSNFIKFRPLNNGDNNPSCEWYVYMPDAMYLKIDNMTSFDTILNLEEILITMVEIYINNIEKERAISSLGFGLQLIEEKNFDEENQNNQYFTGKANLVITRRAIGEKNKKQKIKEINYFLDIFLGLNFGRVIKSSPKLFEKILRLNDLVILKNMRKKSKKFLNSTENKYVFPFEIHVD